VFPNLFVVVWKIEGQTPNKMINPSPKEIEELMKFKLIGYNCRRYDNHILYGRFIGYDNEQLYKLSQRLINGSNGGFSAAYNISYTDVYDFSSKKQSLKKFEIDLGLHRQELGYKWDEPVPESKWLIVADYCINDVIATEATFKAREQDFVARLILSELSGLTPNDTTQQHTSRIIFGEDARPQDKFIYTDLSEMFPGYRFDNGKSSYKGEDPGEGGYVYAEPGMYSNVALLDVASMHPTSLIEMKAFGPYTHKFKEMLDARIAIKHKEFDKAKTMLNGILAKYLDDENQAEALSFALKIVINIVYGLTSASFENKFRDPRNKDNIVAKRGALFMIDLKHAVQEKGFVVAHIKTDSIKIPDATKEIIDFVVKFGKKYGYTFEHEDTFSKMCLVNDAVYISKSENGDWGATGAQFAQPYVFKTLFSKEGIIFQDLCETKAVSTALYLDLNEDLPEGEHQYHFIGKVGEFCPILPGHGGGLLLREKDGKYNAATGSLGYRWLEAEMVKELKKEDSVDRSYYADLVDKAVKTISKYGDFEQFIS
jgi:DNA polymerase elongation subunit (family B)